MCEGVGGVPSNSFLPLLANTTPAPHLIKYFCYSLISHAETLTKLGPMYTRTNYVTLKYATDGWGLDSNGFKLVITAVKDPKHACTEFRCTMMEFCIATDLVCDGINHCADGSDETSSNLCHNNDSGTILGLEMTWFVVLVVSILLILLVCIVAVSICLCRRGINNSRTSNSVPQQNYSLQQMYGSNGAMMPQKQQSQNSGSTTTLTVQGNWRHPAGPLGFRLSTPARARLYCQAK
ncbi:low-density lipoprotein receptor-related protein 2-related [Holotrichia oblita]|uniref:Low-density lipoprotein receptor-related protein 2-related n=1 Tax=Holotrichia oblita TaxID=644536 RepID=A0ACB9TH26_HOLOL|nr:low-density lipoprotein receptor-related protein 2-related [Holotrichia oblita]